MRAALTPMLPRLYQPIRFIVAGVLNTLFGLFAFSVLIHLQMPTWLALLVGNAMGLAFNFITTGGYVFRNISLRNFPRFAGTYFFMYALNLLLINALATWVDNLVLRQAILVLPLSATAYMLMKRFVFISGNKEQP